MAPAPEAEADRVTEPPQLTVTFDPADTVNAQVVPDETVVEIVVVD
ncbi:hypothetical protein [Spirosoma panaciterrae]|nr:hypothetical protein [Spirosoma panaciterrae]